MSKENKTVELKDEELEKVSGGYQKKHQQRVQKIVSGGFGQQVEGKCGITTTSHGCTQYNSSNDQCNGCLGRPLEQEVISVLEQPATR